MDFISRARTNTPLRCLQIELDGLEVRLHLKLESFNPTGSIKFRTAVGLLSSFSSLSSGPIPAGTRVVESTSGNLGIALARLLAEMDCSFMAVVDPRVSRRALDALVCEGAQIVCVTEPDAHGGFLLNRLRMVADLCNADSRLRWTDQYNNPANPAIHRDTTALEIFRQTGGRVDKLFAAVSTGGTLAGIETGLRRLAPSIETHAVDVKGSLVTSAVGFPHLLTGIGASRKSSFLTSMDSYQTHKIADYEAFAYCRMLADDTGLAIGGSSGAVLAASVAAISADPEHFEHPVAVFPDSATNYVETFYDDSWLEERNTLRDVQIVQDIARQRGLRFSLNEALREKE